MHTPITILAISGSLRATSLNTALLRAIAGLAPAPIDIRIYPGLGQYRCSIPTSTPTACLP